MHRSTRPIVLLVEDSNHSENVKRVLDRILANGTIHVAGSGREALDFVFGRGAFEDRSRFPVPSLILLDLQTPETDGFEFLRTVKSDERLKVIPLVAYCALNDPQNLRRLYELGANAVMRKRLTFDATLAAMKHSIHYWLEECERAPV